MVRHLGHRRSQLYWLLFFGVVAGLPGCAQTHAVAIERAPPIAAADVGAPTYRTTCVPCHGEDGRGGAGGGAPLTSARDVNAVIQTVTYGQNNMPPFGGALTSDQIAAVSAYVVEHLATD